MTVRVTATSAARSPLWWAKLRTPKDRGTIRADPAPTSKPAR